jgi:hypothetical protein
MSLTLARKTALLPSLVLVTIASHFTFANPQDSLARFAGTWEGTCQDGRTFVVLTLQVNQNQLDGTVSIANMHGDDQGACMLVSAPPVPEHAQKISHAAIANSVLSFNGLQRPDGTSTRFELKETERDRSELKLLDTPVEKHPWQLVKVQKRE